MPIVFPPGFFEKSWTHQRGVEGQIKCTMLSAGLGRRMDPLTARHLPKPLFPLGGKLPMSEIWVRRMVSCGITDISMNLCVLSDLIKRHFDNGMKFGASITYVEEKVPSGTLGGVCKQALGRDAKRLSSEGDHPTIEPFQGSTLIVPSGDIVTNFGVDLLEQMYEIHRNVGAALTMVLVPIDWERRGDYGTAVLKHSVPREGAISRIGQINAFMEKDPHSKSNLCNASIYMIEMDLLRHLDSYRTEANLSVANPFYDFGKHVFPALLGQLPYVSLGKDFPLWGIEYSGKWFDVGQKQDYLSVNEQLLDGGLDEGLVSLAYEKLPWGYLGNDVSIDFSKVEIIPPVVIGNNCSILPGAVLGPYAIIGDNWHIHDDVHISHSVLWEPYAYFDENDVEVSSQIRRELDPHIVRTGVTIENSIVAGGDIQSDLRRKTVDVKEDGQLGIVDIDWVTAEPRI